MTTITNNQKCLNTGLDPNKVVKQFITDKDWTVKTGVGGIFNALALGLFCVNPMLFPISVCLLAIVQGYLLKTVRVKSKEENAPLPPWNDWFDLFVSGMSWFAIVTMFFFVLLSLFYLSLIVGSILHANKTVDPNFLIWAGGTIIGIKIIAAWFMLFTNTLMANFAEQESMPAGFAYFKVLGRFFKTPLDFTCAWLIGLGLQFVFIALPVVTVIGIFLLPTTIFTAQVLSASILAQAWRSSSPIDADLEKSEPEGESEGESEASETLAETLPEADSKESDNSN